MGKGIGMNPDMAAQRRPGTDWAVRQALDMNDQRTARTVIPDLPRGMSRLGNINMNARPTVRNDDGSHSTEYSYSFGDEKGREVVVPTVVNGRFLTPDGKKPPEKSEQEQAMFRRAQQRYEKTGEHLGIFDNPRDAESYAQFAHDRKGPSPRQRYVVLPSDKQFYGE